MSASWKMVLEQLHFLGKPKVSERLKGKKTQCQAQAESTESMEAVPGIRKKPDTKEFEYDAIT